MKIGNPVTNIGGLISHCRPDPLGDPKLKLKINLQLTSKRGSTINDDDPTLLTTQKLVLLQSLRKKLEILNVTSHHINVADPNLLATLKQNWKSTYNSPANGVVPSMTTTQHSWRPKNPHVHSCLPIKKFEINFAILVQGGDIRNCRPANLDDPSKITDRCHCSLVTLVTKL